MPEQTKAANGKTMIQRSELATMRRGSIKIAFAKLPDSLRTTPESRDLRPSTFALRVLLICYAMQKQLVCRPWRDGITRSAGWLTFC
jgi:hypothetical protein